MPILNEGIANGKVVPLSVVTTERSAVRASSRSPDDEMDVGSETRKKDGCDMVVGALRKVSLGLIGLQ